MSAVNEQVVIVDDDPELRRVVVRLLAAQGMKPIALGNGAELRARLAAGMPDLLILDVGLGDEDGMALAREVRAGSQLPILMLTGHDSVYAKVSGLESGADDYLTKPFDGQELIARVRALIRRSAHVPAADAAPGVWRFGGWTLREIEHELVAPGGGAVALTSHEFRLLCVLVHNAGRTLDRDSLSKALSGREAAPDDRGTDVLIAKLRRKLASHGGGELIKTVRGVGYVLAASAEREA
jgi:two-component system OmpR family response regulator